MQQHIERLLDAVDGRCKQASSIRKPLQKAKVVKELKQFNPRFEEDFAQEKDYDVDRYFFTLAFLHLKQRGDIPSASVSATKSRMEPSHSQQILVIERQDGRCHETSYFIADLNLCDSSREEEYECLAKMQASLCVQG